MLLEACRLAFDDDAPRLVWADEIGGERGELVVLQCDLARGGLAPADVAARRARERELLQRHAVAWSGVHTYGRFEFRRGFVEALQVDLDVFVSCADAIFEAAPLLRSVTVDGPKPLPGGGPPSLASFGQLLELPAFWRLHRLGVFAAGGRYPLGNQIATLLVDAGALGQLTALDISSSSIGGPGIAALTGSGQLEQLDELWLRRHHCRDDSLVEMLGAARHLQSLALVGPHDVVTIAQALPALRSLQIDNVEHGGLDALARSPAARTLTSLRLGGLALHDPHFERFPALVELDLYLQPVTGPIGQLPRLRRLRLAPSTTVEDALAIARPLGGQLELLDLRGARVPEERRAELADLVAGELQTGPASDVPPML